MKSVLRSLPAAGLAVALALIAAPAAAQTPTAPAAVTGKPASAAAIAAAKEILAIKSVSGIYANAVPGIVEQTKNVLLGANLNYQKDLNEVAVIVAKNLAGREKEIGDGMAQIYASEFTEQELKDLATFFKSPLGQKLVASEPKAIQGSMTYMQKWAQSFSEIVNGAFRTEMKKRGKEI
jgi:hypothetical protein